MFTGLIQSLGVIEKNDRNHLLVSVVPMTVKLGDSVAINGVCLTVASKEKKGNRLSLGFDLSEETRSKTTLQTLKRATMVNVEKALSLSDSLGGHIVQGHVDGTGRVAKILKKKESTMIWFHAPREIISVIVPKGSVTVDGVSLTAVNVNRSQFSVALVPFTISHTNLSERRVGDPVNLEADIIGKYVVNYLKKK